MVTQTVFALLLLVAVSAVNASSYCECENDKMHMESHPDRVFELPGWNQPLPSRWYSGYLDYEFHGQQVHTHYVLLEAEETGDCICDKPLIYWSNGGPGASSLFGLLTEIGPLILSDDSLKTEDYTKTGIPTPIYNAHAWTRFGSVLIFDQPAPVGFSHCNGPEEFKAQNCGDIAWTDELTSENIYTALQAFYETKFPNYKQKNLYLTGESYAGIYIPTFARRIVEDPKNDPKNEDAIKLQGFAVGDGCLGTKTSVCGDLLNGDVAASAYWHIVFLAGHHQIPLSDYQTVMKACYHSDQEGFLTFQNQELKEADEVCKAAIEKIKAEVGGFFTYSLYNDCPYRNGLAAIQGGQNDYPCGGGIVLEEYLKLDSVISALHVQSDFFETDNAEGDFKYTPTEPDLTGFYKEINGKLKVLVYNGDTDPAITSFAAQNWTSYLGLEETQHWRPWTIDGCQRMGGYVTRYEGMFDFLTIRGAGHMVPTEKPEASYAFLQAWINGDDYPTFDPKCTKPTSTEAVVTASEVLQVPVDETKASMLRG